MKKKIMSVVFFVLVILSVVPCAFSQNKNPTDKLPTDKAIQENYNIEGIFQCDWNGKYYVRQIGNEILWFGEDDSVSPLWSNVAHGTINGNVLTVIWGDVPKGSIMQHGNLVIQINSNDNFTLISQDGDNFGSSVWNRVNP